MSNSEEPAHDARAEAIEAAIEARLTAFDRHRDDLLGLLQKVCERRPKTKSFDKNESWRHLRFMAGVYLRKEASVGQKQMEVPAADRVKLLHQLGNALGQARCKVNEATQDDVRGRLFLAWCETHGDPDLTDPIIGLFENKFDEVVAGVVADLAALETAAFRAVRQVRQRPGRPGGTSVLQHDFIINLEHAYRDITGKPGGAGPGPFAQFVKKFLEALGRNSLEQSVIEAIKDARKRDKKYPAASRWARSLFAGIGGKTPSSSP
jgi:hypothetical protein